MNENALCAVMGAAPPKTRSRHWTLRDDNHSHHHGVVNLRETPLDIDLSWRRTAADPKQHVGLFRLNLEALLSAGYVRREPSGSMEDRIRVRIIRDDGHFYLQASGDGPRIGLI